MVTQEPDPGWAICSCDVLSQLPKEAEHSCFVGIRMLWAGSGPTGVITVTTEVSYAIDGGVCQDN